MANIKRLTVKKALKLNYTPIDCVRFYRPEISDKEAENILWKHTCFPFDTEIALKQLYNLFNSEQEPERSVATEDAQGTESRNHNNPLSREEGKH